MATVDRLVCQFSKPLSIAHTVRMYLVGLVTCLVLIGALQLMVSVRAASSIQDDNACLVNQLFHVVASVTRRIQQQEEKQSLLESKVVTQLEKTIEQLQNAVDKLNSTVNDNSRKLQEKQANITALQKQNLPSECFDYTVLDEPWRRVSLSNNGSNVMCDRSEMSAGWKRFADSIGGSMPESCPGSANRCGTYFPGWLNGAHPTVVGQISDMQVCFFWSVNCCHWQVSIEVINCGLYYIYNLPLPPLCNLAYCSSA